MGKVVSSQAYADDQDNDVEENPTEAADDDLPATVASEDERETEWKVTLMNWLCNSGGLNAE